jgi:hypothetical protein
VNIVTPEYEVLLVLLLKTELTALAGAPIAHGDMSRIEMRERLPKETRIRLVDWKLRD